MSLKFLTAGESHGPKLISIIDGLPSGIDISVKSINYQLIRRQRGYGAGPRMKIERDKVRIVSGVLEGRSIGSPITLIIDNKDHHKWKGNLIEPFTIPRPGHADLTGVIKYDFHDLRPALERASARETASRVAVGSICKQFLKEFGIMIGGYVVSIGGVIAHLENIELFERFLISELNDVRCPDKSVVDSMINEIEQTIKARDTLGGVIEIFATGVPPGLGSYVQWDRRLEAKLGSALLSVQAIKGVEFGSAFENATKRGTKVHDAIEMQEKKIVRRTNHAGGIEGGISNGEPIIMRVAMKPIATTLHPQKSVDLTTGENVDTKYERSDFCPVPRAVPVLESMVAFVIADALIEKLGGDSITEMLSRYENLRGLQLSDFYLNGIGHEFWPNSDDDE